MNDGISVGGQAISRNDAPEWPLTNELLFSSELVDTFNRLNTLRPRRLQALLAGCRSVKTKRAFLVLARHAGHAWYHRLETHSLDLGKGKRQLCKGGRLDKEYQVTVPEAFTDEH